MAKLPPQPVGVPPGSSYWNDWYEKLRSFVDSATSSVDWTIITNTPTTLAGYGITDAQTKLNNSAGLAAALSDETGTGLCVFNNNPSLINPVLGNATGTSLTVTGTVGAGGAAGFVSNTFIANSRNPIWYFGNAVNFGISYYQGTAGFGAIDTIGMHFGTSTLAGSLFQFVSNGNLRITGGITVGSTTLASSSVALTNGAGAAVGTLTNAPTAGNPTKWLPVNDNGTTRYIPAW